MKFFDEVKALFSADRMKNFDWRSLKKYTSNRAFNDLNRFLENMPQHVTQTMLLIAAIAWSVAGAFGLYTTIQLKQLTELRASLQEADALSPKVPQIKNVPVKSQEIEGFVADIDELYNGLSIQSQGASIVVRGNTIGSFGQFREVMSHILNGGQGWRVDITALCVGRECDKFPLSATLKVSKVSVSNPR